MFDNFKNLYIYANFFEKQNKDVCIYTNNRKMKNVWG